MVHDLLTTALYWPGVALIDLAETSQHVHLGSQKSKLLLKIHHAAANFSQRHHTDPWKFAYRFAALSSSDPVDPPCIRPGEMPSSSGVLLDPAQELRGARRFLADAARTHSTPVC